jgi:hypothetical protein
MALDVGIALRHLHGRIVQPHHPGADRRDHGGGQDEHLAVKTVEPLRDVPRELDVLLLVLAHRHLVGVVEQDVRGHQDRVVEQAGAHRFLARGAVLVLRHALQPPDWRHAVEEPARLGVGADVALDEERALAGIETGRQEHGGQGAGLSSEQLRVLGDRERVEVDDAEVVLLVALLGRPALDRAQVVPEMHVARGLDAAEHAGAPPRGRAA